MIGAPDASIGVMPASPPPPPPPLALPEVLTVDELAALLRVDRKTAYAAIASGEIPGVRRVGRTLRVHRATVVGWLAEGQGRASRSKRQP